MLAGDYLSLQLVRLKASEEWSINKKGLSFIFPKGGAGKFSLGGATQQLAPGDALVIGGEQIGKISVPASGEILFWWFSVQMEHLFPLFAASELRLLDAIESTFRTTKTYPSTTILAEECHRLIRDVPPRFDLDHRSQLLRVAAAIISSELKAMRPGSATYPRVDEHLTTVLEKLSSDEILSLSVDELAGRFGCSRRHLNRLFHQFFGLSVGSFRMELRLLRAVALLRNPDAKVIHVAEGCGFHHLGLFNTCFKRRFGVSPGEWRRQNLAPQAKQSALREGCPLKHNGLCPMSIPVEQSGVQLVPNLQVVVSSKNGKNGSKLETARPAPIGRGKAVGI